MASCEEYMAQPPLSSPLQALLICLHPRIEAIKQQLAPPSPALVPSDPLQPSSGRLIQTIGDELSRLAAKLSYQAKSAAILKCKQLDNETLAPVAGRRIVKLDISTSDLCRKRRRLRV